MPNDQDELNEILSNSQADSDRELKAKYCGSPVPSGSSSDHFSNDANLKKIGVKCQWMNGGGREFIPSTNTYKKLPPGGYEVKYADNIGHYLQKFEIKTEGIIKFPQTNVDKVVKEIQTFWEKQEIFKTYGVSYKRGALLWGPAGGGKTSAIQLVIEDIIKRDGIVLKMISPEPISEGIKIVREIEPETPILVLIEDIDSIIQDHSESALLNIIDGVESLNKICFLATTNYPEKLGARIVNRPSRFDKRFKIDLPNAETREIYLSSLVARGHQQIDMKRWVWDTEGFTISHLKELFVGVIIMSHPYDETLDTLKKMKGKITSQNDDGLKVGFRN